MKKIFVLKNFLLVLLSALLFFVSACSPEQEIEHNSVGELTEYENKNEFPESGGTLRLALVGTKTLNPLRVQNQNNIYVLKLIFDSLFQISPNDVIEPNLCERYVISPDGIQYEFVIKQGVKFHNGSNLTARDVNESLSYLLAGENIYKNRLSNIVSHRYAGNSLFVTLDKPVINFIALMDFPVLCADDLGIASNRYVPNGTGRYKVQSYKVSKELYLSKNENYHKDFSPYICEILVNIVKDNPTGVSMLENFQVDLLTSDVMDLSGYTPKRSLSSAGVSSGQAVFLGINNQHSALLTSKTRQALSTCIDREGLLQATTVQYASVTDLPLPMESFWYNKELPAVGYNQELARNLLSEDGWQDSDGDGMLDKFVYGEKIDLVLNVLVNEENANRIKLADVISKHFNSIGIKSGITVLPFCEYQNRISNGQYDVFVGQTALTNNYDLSFLLKTEENISGISNEMLDQSLNALVYLESETQKQSLFYEICNVLKNESQIIGLYFEEKVIIFDKRIKGSITPSNSDVFYSIENWFISTS